MLTPGSHQQTFSEKGVKVFYLRRNSKKKTKHKTSILSKITKIWFIRTKNELLSFVMSF